MLAEVVPSHERKGDSRQLAQHASCAPWDMPLCYAGPPWHVFGLCIHSSRITRAKDGRCSKLERRTSSHAQSFEHWMAAAHLRTTRGPYCYIYT